MKHHCQFEVLSQLLELAPSKQVLVEIHKKKSFSALIKLFRFMRSHGYLVFHKERNSWGCSGYRCVEYAFISIAQTYRVFQNEVRESALATAAHQWEWFESFFFSNALPSIENTTSIQLFLHYSGRYIVECSSFRGIKVTGLPVLKYFKHAWHLLLTS